MSGLINAKEFLGFSPASRQTGPNERSNKKGKRKN